MLSYYCCNFRTQSGTRLRSTRALHCGHGARSTYAPHLWLKPTSDADSQLTRVKSMVHIFIIKQTPLPHRLAQSFDCNRIESNDNPLHRGHYILRENNTYMTTIRNNEFSLTTELRTSGRRKGKETLIIRKLESSRTTFDTGTKESS